MTIRVYEADAGLVNEAAQAQLEDAYGANNKVLTVTFARETANGGFLCELIVQTLIMDYTGLQVYICLFDKDGSLGSTIKETL
jgi:hypothetical protein